MVKDPETSPNPALRFFDVLRRQPPRFRKYLFAVGLFGVGDFSHSLLILAATQILTPTYGVVRAAQLAGALYVARNIVQVLVSYPAGYLADRFGATSVLAWGYAIGAATGAATAMAFALPSGRMPALVSVFVLGGIYVAVQEALEPTVTAEVLSAETLTTGFGALGAVNGCAKLVASSFTGFVWSAISPQVAFSLATVMMMLGTASLGRIGRLSGQSPT